jgi:hypothetical protein
MTQMPGLGPLNGTGIVLDGHLRLMALLAIGTLLIMFAVLMWAIRSSQKRRRVPVRCPLDGRPAEVEFALGPDGTPEDVTWCSRHGRRLSACDKRCLAAA